MLGLAVLLTVASFCLWVLGTDFTKSWFNFERWKWRRKRD